MQQALRIARNIVRAGRVSNANSVDGTVQVLFEDRDNLVTPDIPVLKSAPMPNVGEQVVCIFLGNALEDGFCLGGFYTSEDPPGGDVT